MLFEPVVRAPAVGGGRLPDDEPHGRCDRARHRDVVATVGPARTGGGQDGQHQRVQGRVVCRLHAARRCRRLGGFRPAGDDWPRRLWRPYRRADLGRLHEAGGPVHAGGAFQVPATLETDELCRVSFKRPVDGCPSTQSISSRQTPSPASIARCTRVTSASAPSGRSRRRSSARCGVCGTESGTEGTFMARGWESKAVESQQAEAWRAPARRPVLDAGGPPSRPPRGARSRPCAGARRTGGAPAPGHRAMLEQAAASLETPRLPRSAREGQSLLGCAGAAGQARERRRIAGAHLFDLLEGPAPACVASGRARGGRSPRPRRQARSPPPRASSTRPTRATPGLDPVARRGIRVR